MSKNSKNANKRAIAAQSTEARKSGGGPATTGKKNNKRNTWFARLAGKVNAPAPNTKQEVEE